MGVQEIYFATEGGERIETKRTGQATQPDENPHYHIPYEFVEYGKVKAMATSVGDQLAGH